MEKYNHKSSKFEQLIAPFHEEIKKYCLSVAKNKWEAEDLYQDSLLKIYLAIKEKKEHHIITKKYLYTIIKNTWIDHKRKKQPELFSNFESNLMKVEFNDSKAREILEIFSEYLNVKQFVIILLVEVFSFTAKETGDVINETEANVYTTLHRTKSKLKKFINSQLDEVQYNRNKHKLDPELFEQFLNGFRQKNPTIIYKSYLSINRIGVEISRLSSGPDKKICFHLKDPDGNILMICT